MFDYECYKRGMREWVKNPAHHRIGLRAVNAYFLHLKGARRVDPRRLQHVLDAMRCPAVTVWIVAADILNQLAGRHPEVPAALEEIARSGKANERQQLAMAMNHPASRRYFRRPFLLNLTRLFLDDPSGKTRLFGVEGVKSHCLPELLPRLTAMARTDPDPRVRRNIKFYTPVLEKLFYTHWHETPLRADMYVLCTPEGEKWLLVRRGDVRDYLDHERTARELLATHQKRPEVVWDDAKCRPAAGASRRVRSGTGRARRRNAISMGGI
jgi:hypothetical protein